MIGLTSKAACAAVIIYSRWRLRGEGTASAFLWRPSCLSSGKNLLRFPFISFIFLTGHLGKTQQWCGAERCLYVAVPNDHDWFGEGSKARPSRAKHSLVSRFARKNLICTTPSALVTNRIVCVLSGVNSCVRLQTSHIKSRVVVHP